jgi:hypothetical protein
MTSTHSMFSLIFNDMLNTAYRSLIQYIPYYMDGSSVHANQVDNNIVCFLLHYLTL